MVLSASEILGHVSTTLTAEQLAVFVDAAYASITERYGPATVNERRRSTSGPVLMLAHRAASITSITEDGEALAADDYALRPGGRMLERKCDGTNPRTTWRGYVDLAYANAITDAERDRVAIALVELDLNYQPGMTGERLGDHQVSFAANSVFNYGIERDTILDSLEPDGVVVF